MRTVLQHRTLSLIVLLLASLALGACASEGDLGAAGDELGQAAEDVQDAVAEVDPEQVFADVQQFVDQNVRLEGNVAETIEDNVFELTDGGQSLPVITAEDVSDLAQDAAVEVQGAVRQFDVDQIEQELGIDLDDATVERLQDQAVVVAENLTQ